MDLLTKFRGIRKYGPDGFIYGDLNHIHGGVYIFDREAPSFDSSDLFEVEPSTVEQLTGISETGFEIYTPLKPVK